MPGNLREASAARRRTGLAHRPLRGAADCAFWTRDLGRILGVARGLGETAPVLLVSGITASINLNPRSGPDDVAAPGDL